MDMRTGITKVTYNIHDLTEYINWIYFFHAWGFQPRYTGIADIHGCDACRAGWLASFPEGERAKAAEAMQLHKEANRMLNKLDANFKVFAIYRLMDANADGDDLLLEGKRFPLLRQQTRIKPENPFLCLSDFVRPLESGIKDTVGAFATTIDPNMESLFKEDDYKLMLVKTLAERLAEAAAEKVHEDIRKKVWGYAPDENLTKKELLNEDYQGIRPAVGYPSLPDISVSFLLDELLDMKQIGIRLTENGMMQPHASVCGLMFAHPAARYFSVGKIGTDQLEDYATRRGIPVEVIRKYLAANLQD
jgi:vitamin B12 dependent methionine synthase, activation domain